MKILSNPTIYAIRALIFIASHQSSGSYVGIHMLSGKLQISFHLLTKTFQLLTRVGMLTSNRGRGGGIALAKPPSEIYLIDVVTALEGDGFFEDCLLGLPGCGEKEPCPIHEYWSKAKNDLEIKFSKTTLEDLSKMEGRIGIID